VWSDVAGRRATARREVDAALQEVGRLYREDDWPGARAALGRAEAFLAAGEAGEARRAAVRRWRADLKMAARLEEIRLKQATGNDPMHGANEDYRRAFRDYGLDLDELSEEGATGLIEGSAIKDRLAGALYDLAWGRRLAGLPDWERLVAIARRVDPDPWRDRLTDAAQRRDRAALVAMAREPGVVQLPPASAVLLARALHQAGEAAAALQLCQRVQPRHPGDAWLNVVIATLLPASRKDEAVGYWRAFLAARPNNAPAMAFFATGMILLGRPADAEAAIEQALRLDRNCFDAHFALGQLRMRQRRLTEAETELREATRLRPEACIPHYSLATVLWQGGKPAEAVGPFRAALKARPDFAWAHGQFGDLLCEQARWEEAAAAYREAIRRQPDYAEAHCGLGRSLRELGRFAESRDAFRLCYLQGSRRPDWRHPSAVWFREAELLLDLERRLPAVLRGEARPRDGREMLLFADVCVKKRLYATAVRLFAEGLAADPKQADDPQSGQRYNAACAAALAGCGKGEDATRLGEEERARLRRQALAWLQADRAALAGLAEAGRKQRSVLSQSMRHWQRDPDLAGVRGEQAVNLLPGAERPGWRELWEQVEALRRQAEAPTKK
jgi:tetratricopeptide (TPR) repeat protein